MTSVRHVIACLLGKDRNCGVINDIAEILSPGIIARLKLLTCICGKQFDKRFNFAIHVSRCRKMQDLAKQILILYLATRNKITHIGTYPNIKWKCMICGYTSPNRQEVVKHILQQHLAKTPTK